jgi:hypothetical protein
VEKVRHGGATVPVNRYVAHTLAKPPVLLDYTEALGRFAGVFGKEAVLVRCYDRKQFAGGSIFSDVLHALDIGPIDQFVIPESRLNASTDARTLELIRVANSLELDQPVQKRLINFLKSSATDSRPDLISPGTRKEILTRYSQSNAFIAREYLGRDNGILFDEQVKPDDEWAEPVRLNQKSLLAMLVEEVTKK